MYSFGNFSAFFLWSPLGNYEKKSCLNKLKFWEASRNQKRGICWKFKLSISLGTQKSAKTPPAVGKMIRPFRENFFVDSLNQNSWKHVVNSLKDISSSVTYEIVSGDQNLFKINPETGEIKTIRGLDYEQQRMHFLTISTEEARGTFNLGTAK